ncbi:hypothetical protein GH839_28155 [Bacillus thuringiensis]|nr:hypothetical protein [Bacillus thuringiensis]
MIYGSVPPRKNKNINLAYPIRLTVKSNITLPTQLSYGAWSNRVGNKFTSLQKIKRSWRRRKVVYTGYITNEGLELALDAIGDFEGVTATVVCL